MSSNVFDTAIAKVAQLEGGYVNDPSDRGGETNHGVTIAVARAYGYNGAMRDLQKSMAVEIFRQRYYVEPGFDKLEPIFPEMAAWLLDTGINMGQATAGMLLQRNLNALNNQAAMYPDLTEDGRLGTLTRAALRTYIQKRGAEGKRRLLRACEALQWARYVDITRNNPSQERFAYGWMDRAFD